LQNLENEWRAAQFHIHRFCAYEKKKYKGVLVVDRLSGTRNCDDPPIAINEDHIGIVKPDGVNHDSYVAVQNAFKRYPIVDEKPAKPAKVLRSFVLVAPGPLVNSDSWDFIVSHKGEERVDSIDVMFTDADKLEHIRHVTPAGVSVLPSEYSILMHIDQMYPKCSGPRG